MKTRRQLLFVASTWPSATLTVALAVRGVASRPWERTFAAANGAHVIVSSLSGGDDVQRVAHQAGVTTSTGVRAVAFARLTSEGRTFDVRLVGVGSSMPPVDKPILVAGRWPRAGELLLERSFARQLHLQVGDVLTGRAGVPVPVAGVASVASADPYPATQPGLGLVQRETMAMLARMRTRWGQTIGVRLSDPSAAPSFAESVRHDLGPAVQVETWQQARASAVASVRTARVVLLSFSVLLLLAAGLVLAVLVGSRVFAQLRTVALLKAAGLTPLELAWVFLLEQITFGAIGAAAGLVIGTRLAPAIVTPSASLLDAPSVATPSWLSVLTIAVAVLSTVCVFTLVPALQLGRRTTTFVLAAVVRAPHGRRRRRGSLLWSSRLPVWVALAERDAFSNRGRALALGSSLAVAVGACVATLAMDATLSLPVDHSDAAGLRPVVYGLDAVLLTVVIVNLVATLTLGLRERRRDLGLQAAVGMTRREIVRGVATAQSLIATLAAIAGIPFGLALFRVALAGSGSSGPIGYPTWWHVVLVALGAVITAFAVSTPLALQATRVRVAETLRLG